MGDYDEYIARLSRLHSRIEAISSGIDAALKAVREVDRAVEAVAEHPEVRFVRVLAAHQSDAGEEGREDG